MSQIRHLKTRDVRQSTAMVSGTKWVRDMSIRSGSCRSSTLKIPRPPRRTILLSNGEQQIYGRRGILGRCVGWDDRVPRRGDDPAQPGRSAPEKERSGFNRAAAPRPHGSASHQVLVYWDSRLKLVTPDPPQRVTSWNASYSREKGNGGL